MLKLIAKKRLRYPRGPNGKEYQRGDTFEALSERDKKALVLVGAAQEGPMTPLRVAEPQPVTTRAMQPETPAPDTEAPKPRNYRRRDMTPEQN